MVELAGYGQHHPLSAGVLSIVAASLGIGVLLGALRAATVRLWRRDGQVVRQGSWLTVLLWLVSVGGHLGLTALLHGGGAAAAGAAALLYPASRWAHSNWCCRPGPPAGHLAGRAGVSGP